MVLGEEFFECDDCSCSSSFTSNLEPNYSPDYKLKPTHIDIQLNFQKWPKRNIKASITHTVECVKPESVLKFNGVGFFDLEVLDLETKSSKFRYDGKVITIWWEQEWKIHEKRKIQLNYNIIEPCGGIDFSDESPFNHEYAITDHEPERARFFI
jgi:hypothetical protein